MKCTKRLLATLLASAVVTAPVTLPAAATAFNLPDFNILVDNTNVSINGNCSGTFIRSDLILTANHCIAAQFMDKEVDEVSADGTVTKRTVRVSVPGVAYKLLLVDGNEAGRVLVRYDVVKHDAEVDMALLKVRLPALAPQVSSLIACQRPQRGEPVWSVGNPLGILYASIGQGVVSSVDRSYADIGIDDNNTHRFIQHTALQLPGSSGGAVYNAQEKIIGVIVRGNGFVSLTTDTDDLNKFLEDTGVACK